ncbi:MAG: ribonuclease Z [Bacteroidia bacterium]|nr:ribonuclease Z [Bacteroidia bacterium]
MNRFELTILGCGSATPTNKRNASAQLLNVAERFFLIDCGEGTQIQLRKFKCNFRKLDRILISHLHGDHYFGLIGLLQSFHLLGRKKKLTIYAPAPLKDVIELQNKVSETYLNYHIEYVDLDPKKATLIFEDEKVEVSSFPLDHRIDCTGFLFREKKLPRNIIKEKLLKKNISVAEIHKLKLGFDALDEDGNPVKNSELTTDPPTPRSYAYCSDTRYNERIIEFINGVDLLYHESTFLNDMQERAVKTRHSTAQEAATIAKKAAVKKLLLGHFSSRYEDETEFLKEAVPVFENTLLASEGVIFSV